MLIKVISSVNIYEAVKDAFRCINPKDIDTNYFIVVPDRFSLQAEKILFETLNLKSTFNVNIISLTGLAEKVLQKTKYNYSNSSVLEGVLIVKKACETLKDKLKFYTKTTPNFCLEMYKTIIQIKSSLLSADDLCYEGVKSSL